MIFFSLNIHIESKKKKEMIYQLDVSLLTNNLRNKRKETEINNEISFFFVFEKKKKKRTVNRSNTFF
jgi:hypothetical protein